MEVSREVWAYIAGLFDGEGTATVASDGRRIWAVASITLVTPAVLIYLKSMFGGSLKPDTPKKSTHRVSWRWVLTGPPAVKFLSYLRSYLRIKDRAVEAVLEAAALVGKRGRRLSILDIESRREAIIKVREVNKRGT